MSTPVKQLKDENNAVFYPQTAKAAISDYDAPKITMQSTDPGEGAPLGANEFIAVTARALLLEFYPVGSIYMSATMSTATQVQNALGGTWEAWGAGRVPVGMGSNGTTNYTTVEATGGSETHSHAARGSLHADIWLNWQNSYNEFVMKASGNGSFTGGRFTQGGNTYQDASRSVPNSVMVEGNTATADSRQPYITCYMYKRVA